MAGAETTLALSPDGQEVVGAAPARVTTNDVSVTRAGTATTVWDTRTGKAKFVLQSREATAIVRFSPDGKTIVTAGGGNSAQVWDAATGRRVTTLRGHTGSIRDVSFSHDGTFVATASEDGTVRVWLPRTGQVLDEVRQDQTGHTNRVVFDPNGPRVLVLGSDGAAAIYSCEECGPIDDLLTLAAEHKARSSTP
jgi:WD40 repeat protein